MVKALEIVNLSYQNFKNIDISFEKGKFYSIVGCNKSGKTTLFKLISGLLPSNDVICCDGIYLNNRNIIQYIRKIGITERVNSDSFVYQKVYDEMSYPLYNLGFNKSRRDKRINEILSFFNADSLIDKNINELNICERQLLLIMISLLHKPKVLLLDSVFDVFSRNEREDIITLLRKYINNQNLTIISFASNLNESKFSDKIIMLSNFKILGEFLEDDIYNDDKLFYQNGLEIPFIIDLAIKLKVYNIIDKKCNDLKEMVNDIWP